MFSKMASPSVAYFPAFLLTRHILSRFFLCGCQPVTSKKGLPFGSSVGMGS